MTRRLSARHIVEHTWRADTICVGMPLSTLYVTWKTTPPQLRSNEWSDATRHAHAVQTIIIQNPDSTTPFIFDFAISDPPLTIFHEGEHRTLCRDYIRRVFNSLITVYFPFYQYDNILSDPHNMIWQWRGDKSTLLSDLHQYNIPNSSRRSFFPQVFRDLMAPCMNGSVSGKLQEPCGPCQTTCRTSSW